MPLKNWSERERSQQEIIAEISQPLGAIPGAPARAFGSNSLNLRGQGGGLGLALTGGSYTGIVAAWRSAFQKVIQQEMPALGMPRISYQPTQPQLRVNIDRRRAEELGVKLSDIATTLRVAINGDDLADLNVGDQAIPVILQAVTSQVQDPTDLANLYVGSSNGGLVPLSSLATISEEGVAAELERQAQRRAIEMEMELPEELPIQIAVEQLRALAEQHLPANIGLVFLGEAQTFEGKTAREVTLTYVLAFIIVLLVLAAQFESLNSAVVVMATVPFGIAAALFALFLTGTSINIYSQMGLVMLIRLLAKSAMLCWSSLADQLRDHVL